MQFITLTTDWGIRDHYAGMFKGLLFNNIPQCSIIDISHQVAPKNIQQAAYIFRNAYNTFPAGTIHFIGVNSYNRQKPELLVIKKEGYYFIGMNDGFFSLVFPEQPVDVIVLDETASLHSYNLQHITGVMSLIAAGKNIYELGSRPAELAQKSTFNPVIEEEVIRGTVIYIDESGNVVTNIDRTLFNEQRRGRNFEIVTRKMQHTLNEISEQYTDVDPGNMVALFNSAGNLEIAINQDHASRLLGLKLNDNIRIEFK